MSRIAATFACLSTLLSVSDAYAQWVQALGSERQAAEFCRFSEPHDGASAETADAGKLEAYQNERRHRAQRPVVVTLDQAGAPAVGYDRITGTFSVSLARPARFANGYAVKFDLGTADFAVPEEKGIKLHARYEAGLARLRLTFLPVAWSDHERPLCRHEDARNVLDGDVLEAALVDEAGDALATFRTSLGREVALMREHRIQGYLDSVVPVVTISTLSPMKSGVGTIDEELADSVRASLRATLYGCYVGGLKRNARLQGALVLQFGPAAVDGPRVLVDSLHDDETTACAVKRVTAWTARQTLLQPDDQFKTAVFFKLEENPNL